MSCRSSFSFTITAQPRRRRGTSVWPDYRDYGRDRGRRAVTSMNGDGDDVLAGLRGLQGGELAVEQLLREEGASRGAQPPLKQLAIHPQEDQPRLGPSGQQHVPVAPF